MVEAHDRVRSRSATVVDFEGLTAVAQSSAFSRTCSVVQGEVTGVTVGSFCYSGAPLPASRIPLCVQPAQHFAPQKARLTCWGGIRGSSWSRTALRACSQGRSKRGE